MRQLLIIFLCFSPLLIFGQQDLEKVDQLLKKIELLENEINLLKKQSESYKVQLDNTNNDLNNHEKIILNQVEILNHKVTANDSLLSKTHRTFNHISKQLTINSDSIKTTRLDFYSSNYKIKIASDYISELDKRLQQESKMKWERVSQNISMVSSILLSFNNKINILKLSIAKDKKGNFIQKLANPESGVFGKKFSEIVTDLVSVHILQNEKNNFAKKRRDEVMASVQSITQSPILQAVPTLGTALNISNSVIALFRAISYGNSDINVESITNFEKELSKYLLFYQSLSENTNKYDFAISQIDVKIDLLKSNYCEYVYFLGKEVGLESKNVGNCDEYVHDLLEFIKIQEKNIIKETGSYIVCLGKYQQLIDLNNELGQLQSIFDQFEEIYLLYQKATSSYKADIEGSLEYAKSYNFTKKSDFKEINDELKKVVDDSNDAFVKTIGIESLKNELGQIDYSKVY